MKPTLLTKVADNVRRRTLRQSHPAASASLPRRLRFPDLSVVVIFAMASVRAAEPLPSWNDTAPKKAIVAFVEKVTKAGSPDFVPPAERIATFDQDGTLWVEHPMYSQVMYCLERVPALVKAKPELANKPPFSTVLELLHGDRAAMAKLDLKAIEEVALATLTGMSVDTFSAEAKEWLARAKDPRWKRPTRN